jgi:hypothetical protein
VSLLRTEVTKLEEAGIRPVLECSIRLHDRSVMHYRVDLFVQGRK